MKFAKVEFASDDDAAKALHGIMQRGRITGLRDGSFIVPAPALDWLNEQRIPFKLVQMLNHDDVVQTLRDHLAHPA
jgi:hypothetical protein